MLTDEEKHEIENEFRFYPDKYSAGIEALKIVQRRRGWVSDEALKDVAAFIEVSDAELDGVATFYSMIRRKPVGRHVILLCNSVSCWITGYRDLEARLIQRLGVEPGQTSADGRFTLLRMACLGACDHAPVMMIDNDLHTDLTETHIDEVLQQYP